MTPAVFKIHIGQSSVDSSVTMNGEDISGQLRRVSVECGGNELTRLTLETVPGKASGDLAGTYMPVPRCETCSWWTLIRTPAGRCDALQIATHDDFGCVQFTATTAKP